MRLNTDEWNLLLKLTTYNHMDCWFDLRECKRGYDFVWDAENNVRMSLHDAVEQIAEGMYAEDLKLFPNSKEIWNGLMEKLGLDFHKVK